MKFKPLFFFFILAISIVGSAYAKQSCFELVRYNLVHSNGERELTSLKKCNSHSGLIIEIKFQSQGTLITKLVPLKKYQQFSTKLLGYLVDPKLSSSPKLCKLNFELSYQVKSHQDPVVERGCVVGDNHKMNKVQNIIFLFMNEQILSKSDKSGLKLL
ncbi:MAG: hypothetical protein HOE90_02125 [Bacteriovoracaceae bacterium]|jgi:hypothetical protein|nr:hypothetical protein [Bacteriovoracaceae bacterium]